MAYLARRRCAKLSLLFLFVPIAACTHDETIEAALHFLRLRGAETDISSIVPSPARLPFYSSIIYDTHALYEHLVGA